jgi:hypothetical protein
MEHRMIGAVAAGMLAVGALGVWAVLRPGHAPPRPPSAMTTSLTASPEPGDSERPPRLDPLGDPLFPEAGPLAKARAHRWILNPTGPTPFYWFTISAPGWRSGGYQDVPGGGGRIEKGTPGTPDGAVITFWRPNNVYADPCGHLLSNPRPSELDLPRAVAAIPGTELVNGPTSLNGGQQVVLRIPEDIECEPQEFYLWAAGEHPRAARAHGSTITVSIIDPPPWAGPSIFVEAETYKGASPELEREVQQIVDSFAPGGGSG